MVTDRPLGASPQQKIADIFRGHPAGVYLIAVVEVWERFSFYGMRALLVLFLIAPITSGGFGWTTVQALQFYGAYIALAYMTPIIGGYMADHLLGPRRSLLVGAILMCIGHFLMVGPVLFPWIIGFVSGYPLGEILHQLTSVPIGGLTITPEIRAALEALSTARSVSGSQVDMKALELAYLSMGYSFYGAAGLIVLGTGFFKPSTYSVIGRLYKDDDPQRENGVFLYQVAVNTGAIFSALIAGTLGEKFGWHYGFSAAGVGMLVAAIIYTLRQQTYLGHIPHTPPARAYKRQQRERRGRSRVERDRLIVIGFMGVFSGLFWMAAEQSGGSISIYAAQQTDRDMMGFEIPATWFQSLNPFFVVLFTPLAMIIWTSAGRHINQAQKFGIGFIFTAIGFLMMVGAFWEASVASDGKSAALWLVAAYLFMTFGELCINSVGLNLVNTYAPVRMLGSVLALWFLCTALGNFLSGIVGSLTASYADGIVFGGIAAGCLGAAILLFTGSRWWSRFVHDHEGRDG